MIDDLSVDQFILYNLILTVRTGKVSGNVLSLAIGVVCLSRWLTTASRLLRLYVSFHSLSKKAEGVLKVLAQFVISCYGPSWFQIKG